MTISQQSGSIRTRGPSLTVTPRTLLNVDCRRVEFLSGCSAIRARHAHSVSLARCFLALANGAVQPTVRCPVLKSFTGSITHVFRENPPGNPPVQQLHTDCSAGILVIRPPTDRSRPSATALHRPFPMHYSDAPANFAHPPRTNIAVRARENTQPSGHAVIPTSLAAHVVTVAVSRRCAV